MNYFSNYFWGLGILIGIINGILIRNKIQMVSLGNEGYNREIEDKLIKGVFGAITIPFALLQIIQLISGYENAFFVFFHDYTNPFYWAGVSVMVISWGLYLYWVFLKKGAQVLLKYNNSFFLYMLSIK